MIKHNLNNFGVVVYYLFSDIPPHSTHKMARHAGNIYIQWMILYYCSDRWNFNSFGIFCNLLMKFNELLYIMYARFQFLAGLISLNP